MPWKECSIVSQRKEFVKLALPEGANISELCRRFEISRKTAYKWLLRYRGRGVEDLADRSRRPRGSPGQTPQAMEQAVLQVRSDHPAWGGRKIRRVLRNHGHSSAPAASTVTAILRRNGLIDEVESRKRQAFQRFEHPSPNDLWQMDFKGHFAMTVGRCHPLTVLDDHSRYCVGLQACGNERGLTVRSRLTGLFRRHGLPRRMLMDNGSPWGFDADHPWTPLTAWLLRLGIGVSHGRPYHPQTQGKDERFHRTLQAEVVSRRRYQDLATCQSSFDDWRTVYNLERPHEALGMDTPVTRYVVSDRGYPEQLCPIEYDSGDTVRKVQLGGVLHYNGGVFKVGKAFHGNPVALRATERDGLLDVYFCRQRVAWLDLKGGLSGPANGRRRMGVEDEASVVCGSPSGGHASVRCATSGPAPRGASGLAESH